MKLGSLFLMFILLLANIVMPVAGSSTDRVNLYTVTANSSTVNYFFNGIKYDDVCHVRTQGGNLNVRNSRGKIIGKLPNGTRVNVATLIEESTLVTITATVGRKFIKGLVEARYLDCYQ